MSSDDIAISVSNLGKRYEIYNKPGDRLKQFIIPKLCRILPVLKRFFATRIDSQGNLVFFNEFWALKNVSFEIKKGETVGIIGRNGSGKSTLLQLICGTLNPTVGEIEVNGRIAALLELGAGFNPEFTGRENVRMSCALLGMSPHEAESSFHEIADFADIGEFIDQPVKTYSSGMFVRLAFAVNIVCKPEIMIVDEALAVGDMSFQAKCMTALTRIQRNGATILFVSHDIGSVKTLCSIAIHLEQGDLVALGSAPDVAEHYISVMREKINLEHKKSDFDNKNIISPLNINNYSGPNSLVFINSENFYKKHALFRYGTSEVQVTYAELLDEYGENINSIEFDQIVMIRIYIKSYKKMKFSVAYYVHDQNKIPILGAWIQQVGNELIDAEEQDKFIVTYKTRMPLQEGNYGIQLEIAVPLILDKTTKFIDVVNDGIVFNVRPRYPTRVWSKVFIPNTVDIHLIQS